MTDLMAAVEFNKDPGFRAAEVKAYRDQIQLMRANAAIFSCTGMTRIADDMRECADRMQKRVEELV